MINKIHLRFLVSLVLAYTIFAVSLPQIGYAQTAPQKQASADLQSRLATIEQKVDARRKELGIPGMSLAIVKDGEVIFAKGFGYKDFTKKIPVTADTQFAIGSATKAFTALSVLMSQEEGKLNLDDNPKKYLPYFKINNPEIDKNITIRDLLSHSSGLNRTDLAMITGKLTREELIKVAGEAKPTAGLREKFQYQNIMFAAAGEIVAQVQKQSWESFIEDKIFKPLGMTNSTISVEQMQKAKDFSLGYDYNFDTKETRNLPTRDILQVAPAGSINSSAQDMARWLKFMLAGGESNGKRLVSENLFAELIKPQMKITPRGELSYGLGWFVRSWNNFKVVEHGGNIDGFNSEVAMIPEKKLGFVMLTNVSASPLGSELMPVIWENILGNPDKTQPTVNELQKEVGRYHFEAAGFDIEVKLQDGKLIAIAPNQPTYTLENVSGRRYKLTGAPEGFFVTFKDSEIYLEQPQGNFTLPKTNAETKIEVKNPAALKELVGKYQSEKSQLIVEIKEVGGSVALVVEGQQPYFLSEKEKDIYRMNPLPDDFSLKVKRSADGKISNIILAQPQGEPSFRRMDGKIDSGMKITVDELMAKTIEAAGGEANWRKITSRVTVADIDLIHQGVTGTTISYAKFPNKSASETTMTAIGKTIAKGFEFFDGTTGEEFFTFAPIEKYAGQKLEDAKLGSDFLSLLNWKTNYKTVEIKGMEKVGDEECFVVEFTPEKGTAAVEMYSTKTFLLMKRRGVIASSTSDQKSPYSVTFSDYRDVDGIKLPFKSVNTNSSTGDVITIVKSVKHNVAIDDKVFTERKLVLE